MKLSAMFIYLKAKSLHWFNGLSAVLNGGADHQLCRTCLGTWSKNYWADCEKCCFFLKLVFMSVRIFSFNAIHSVIKKVFHKGPVAANGACQKWHYFIFGYFSTKLGTFVDGHEKIII
jgi:hypothetical protein